MFTEAEKIKAIQLYKETGSFAVTRRMLGYPNSPATIKSWVKDIDKNGCFTNTYKRIERNYSKEEIDFACEYYQECLNIEQTINDIGYPESRMTLWRWLKNKGIVLTKNRNASNFSDDEKKNIIREYFSSNKSQAEFVKKYNISPPCISNWIRKFGLAKEDAVAMPKDDEIIVEETVTPPRSDQEEIDELKKEIARLKAQKVAASRKTKEAEAELKLLKAELEEAQLEYDILEKAAELLKKVNGINIDALKNKEKAVVINALREKHKLAKLLKSLKMAKSSYKYQVKSLQHDKYKELRIEIRIIFNDNYQAYGSERIHKELKNQGITVSEKVIRRLMKEENIHPFVPRMKKYSSYQGEISPSVPDLYKHDFKADGPYTKAVTDITEFSLKDGKVYLSPMIDLYDGCPVNWKIGTSPNKELTNSMLIEFHNTVPGDAHPIIHSDRGCHYRIPDWINLMNEFGYTRSMSRKGCSPDNAACEGFFGILKREFFYNHDWNNATREEFMKELDKYLTWFRIKRIKERLGYISPAEYRSRGSL